MVKTLLIVTLGLILVTAIAVAQKNKDQLIKTYLSDTTGFTTYPEVYLLENLKLPKKYTEFEINSAVDYMSRTDTISRVLYHKE